MVDVVTSSVAAYTADAETQTRSTGYNVQASNWNQIINDLRSLNDSLNGSQQITALDISGTLDVDGNATFNGTGAAIDLTNAAAYFRAQKDASDNNAPIQFFTDHGSGLRLTWALHNRSDETFWIARYNSSGTYQGSPIAINNSTGAIVTEGEVEINGDLNHDGSNIGFFGTTPAAQAAAYTPTNVSTDRSYDANATTLAEIADVLGTLIADLQSYGLLQ